MERVQRLIDEEARAVAEAVRTWEKKLEQVRRETEEERKP